MQAFPQRFHRYQHEKRFRISLKIHVSEKDAHPLMVMPTRLAKQWDGFQSIILFSLTVIIKHRAKFRDRRNVHESQISLSAIKSLCYDSLDYI
jgi:hypothetical protein